MWPDELDPKEMPRHFFAPDADLDYAGAERANVDAQNYSLHPRYWYIDTWQTCTQCKAPFPFTIEEQRFWYEERRFYVASYPIRCKKCRRDQRRLEEARQRYGDLREQAVRRDASKELKVEVLALIDELEAAGERLSDRMIQCREVLRQQIKALDD